MVKRYVVGDSNHNMIQQALSQCHFPGEKKHSKRAKWNQAKFNR